MMETSKERFTCLVKDCDTTFTNNNNEDHFSWHEKKHEMMLSLGLTSIKNSETGISSMADQTPTPTRFIRNCEEVGLFQDLQNVNPFDEIFKSAVESTKTCLDVPQSASDDTLHTPQIYPHIEEKNNYTEKESNITSKVVETNDNLKKRIREALTLSRLQKSPTIITVNQPIPIETLKIIDNKRVCNKKSTKPKSTSTSDTNLDTAVSGYVLRVREMNRAAQHRCRLRKQHQRKEMETELKELKAENKKLRTLNVFLDQRVKQLEGELASNQTKQQTEPLQIITSAIPPNSTTTKMHDSTKSCNSSILIQSTTVPLLPTGFPTEPLVLNEPTNGRSVIVDNTNKTNSSNILITVPSSICQNTTTSFNGQSVFYIVSPPTTAQHLLVDIKKNKNTVRHKRIVPKLTF